MTHQPRGNPSKQNAKPSTFRVFVLVVLALALVVYRFLWPWTPFWVDALVIAAAIVIYVCRPSKPSADGNRGA